MRFTACKKSTTGLQEGKLKSSCILFAVKNCVLIFVYVLQSISICFTVKGTLQLIHCGRSVLLIRHPCVRDVWPSLSLCMRDSSSLLVIFLSLVSPIIGFTDCSLLFLSAVQFACHTPLT